MKKVRLLLILALLLGGNLLHAQGFFKKNESVDSAFTHNYAGTRAGLIQLLTDIQAANIKSRIKISKYLRPKEEEYNIIFTSPNFARNTYLYHKKLNHTSAYILQPNLTDQTDILLWEASQTDFKSYINDAVYFPGGYKEIADMLSADFQYFRIKYVKPGKSTGSAYDLIVFVNGHWRFFPRPWAVNIKK